MAAAAIVTRVQVGCRMGEREWRRQSDCGGSVGWQCMNWKEEHRILCSALPTVPLNKDGSQKQISFIFVESSAHRNAPGASYVIPARPSLLKSRPTVSLFEVHAHSNAPIASYILPARLFVHVPSALPLPRLRRRPRRLSLRPLRAHRQWQRQAAADDEVARHPPLVHNASNPNRISR